MKEMAKKDHAMAHKHENSLLLSQKRRVKLYGSLVLLPN